MELEIVLDRSDTPLLSHQISRAITRLIGNGALPVGSQLPATRELARRLQVGRTTVVEAYEILSHQGIVTARRGSGTLVQGLTAADPTAHRRTGEARRCSLSRLRDVDADIDFRADLPDLSSFPKQKWLAAIIRSGRKLAGSDLNYGDPSGSGRLRQALARYLCRSRGLQVNERNIVITAGAIQSMDLVLRALPDYSEVVVEDPGPVELRTVMRARGIAVLALPVDGEGLRTDLLPEDGRVPG